MLYLLPQSLHPNLNHEGARRMQRALAAGLGASATDEEVVDCEQARRSTPADRLARVEAALEALADGEVRLLASTAPVQVRAEATERHAHSADGREFAVYNIAVLARTLG